MARETKEERIVRGMTAPLMEQLMELKHLAANGSKESDVEAWCQSLIKNVLGFTASNGYIVKSQETRGKMRFDLVVSPSNRPDQVFVVAEVKKLGGNLNKSDLRSGKSQLAEYLKQLGDVRWGILTNGYEWTLYDFKSDLSSVINLDLRNEKQEIDTSNKGVNEAAWSLLDLSSFYFESGTWEKMSTEAQALSPDSLARSILSIEVVKKIAKILNSEHEYKVSVDLLSDRLSGLIEHGLDDTVSAWNETKRLELDRYIRSQKRLAKRSRRKTGDEKQSEAFSENTTEAPTEPSASGVTEADPNSKKDVA